MEKRALDYTTAPEDRVPLWRKLTYSAGVWPEPLFMGTIGNLIVPFYNGVLGIPGTMIGLVLFVPRMWDAITDPFIGKWSDGCRSPWGRRRPFILFGGIATVVTYLLLWTPLSTSDAGFELMGQFYHWNLIYLLIVGVLFFTAYTAYSIPYGALAVEMSFDYKERNAIMAIRKAVHGLGEMLIGTMPFIGATIAGWFGRGEDERFSYGAAAASFALVSVFLMILTFFGTTERVAAENVKKMHLLQSMIITLKNVLFLRLAFAVLVIVLGIMTFATFVNYLFLYYLDNKGLMAVYSLVNGILSIFFAFAWWFIANRIGKPHALVFAQFLLLTANLSAYFTFNPEYPYLIFITSVLYSLGWSGILVMMPSIMAEIIDMDELQTHARREGSYGGVYGFIFKLGVAAAMPVLGLGVDFAGFDPDLGVAQTPETFHNLRIMTALVSGAFVLLSMPFMWRFPLTPERAMEVRRQLEERRGKVTAMH